MILNNLRQKQNWISEFNKLKDLIPSNWKDLLRNHAPTKNDDKVEFSKNVLISHSGIKVNDEEIQMKKLKQKDIYNVCLYPVTPPICMHKWREYFQCNLEFESLFKEKRHALYNRKSYDFHWKIIHRVIFCETKLKQMKKSNGICKLCNEYEEDLAHLVYLCPKINVLWNKIENLLMNILAIDLQLDVRKIILGITLDECDKNVSIKVFINFVILMTKWCIWKHRNDVKYGNQEVKESKYIYDIILKMCQKDIQTISKSIFYHKCKQELKVYMSDLLEENC